jgi:uncharacterized protein (TIGR03067 family)
MYRVTALLFVLVTARATTAPAPLPRAPKQNGAGELKKMQGTWAVVSRTVNGSESKNRIDTVVIAGDHLQFLVMGEVRTEWAITLDVTKNPKVFDRARAAVRGRTAERGGKSEPLVFRGIYHLEGDTLRIVSTMVRGSQERPSDFQAARLGETLYILKRKKP